METDQILGLSLYKKQRFLPAEYRNINNLFDREYSYDCYCSECKRESVFYKKNYPGAKSIGNISMKVDFADTLNNREPLFKSLVLYCSRNENHKMAFFFSLYKSSASYIDLIKVGQVPSSADLLIASTKKYSKVLGTTESHELSKAIGLFSHGVGIGSFVYLRRIFENLIEKAHQQAIQTTEWDDKEYGKARMHEKVRMLDQYLPEFLVENRLIYSILSKGIHELTEEECLNAFDAVRLAIELILDEEIARKERERKKQEAAQSIASLHQELK